MGLQACRSNFWSGIALVCKTKASGWNHSPLRLRAPQWPDRWISRIEGS
jgi:hypothetical protein